ncbi:flagellar hook-basal body complex protein FliE [Desulfohalovibrio reitneri]|uniref:flagellar hook-basal body complex protein FliE n=1 Tax=Desulfohalovibrio reitneri TaxID=1307759 RepID=UPI0004A6F18B|nr:flagellar hook-basal body complex protein FliE [Desulfohalovibrio reitneri]
MAVTPIGNAALKAYQQVAQDRQQKMQQVQSQVQKTEQQPRSFSETVTDSLKEVNEQQFKGVDMVENFATGKNTNVHEVMISLQKAGVAMSMTSAVRNKVMTAYKEIMRMSL